MKRSSTLFAVLAFCGASSLWAGNGNEADPTALLAVQYNVHISFGPQGAGGGIVSCTNPTSYNGATVCPSVTTFNIPNGNRFVITSISGAVDYSPKRRQRSHEPEREHRGQRRRPDFFQPVSAR